MSDYTLTTSLICPVCKSNNFQESTSGLVFKKTIHQCNKCGTVLEQSGKDEKATYTVKKVGEDYSNLTPLLANKSFRIHELANHKINIISDAQIVAFSNGDLDELSIQMEGVSLPVNIALKKDEQIKFYLSAISYLEERSKRERSTGYSFRITKGMWYRTSSTPKYENQVEHLDSGYLVITNKRYIFIGGRKNVDQPYKKVTAVNIHSDGIGIVRSNKQRTEYFTGGYHWALLGSVITGLVKRENMK